MRVGDRVGPYEVVGVLGRGGMGVVYEVRHPDVPRRLALKLIDPVGADADALLRFQREGEALARVRHPGVVAVHAAGRAARGAPFLVMDVVEGGPLPSEAVAPARAARLVRDLADAVAALHQAGLVHRDLKPSNVMLASDDRPVLLDLGLARALDAQRLTATGTILGTPAYMSPEQAQGLPADARADVYGLGAVLYALLTGRPPSRPTRAARSPCSTPSSTATRPGRERWCPRSPRRSTRSCAAPWRRTRPTGRPRRRRCVTRSTRSSSAAPSRHGGARRRSSPPRPPPRCWSSSASCSRPVRRARRLHRPRRRRPRPPSPSRSRPRRRRPPSRSAGSSTPTSARAGACGGASRGLTTSWCTARARRTWPCGA